MNNIFTTDTFSKNQPKSALIGCDCDIIVDIWRGRDFAGDFYLGGWWCLVLGFSLGQAKQCLI
jgi:hypothetical protein